MALAPLHHCSKHYVGHARSEGLLLRSSCGSEILGDDVINSEDEREGGNLPSEPRAELRGAEM